jgi:AraC-like DNA-binding protein
MSQASINMILQQSGWLALQGPLIDVASHSHRALQLVLPLDSPCTLEIDDRSICCQCPVAINSGVKHALHGQSVLILLIEPACHLGRTLQQQHLHKNPVARLPMTMADIEPGGVASLATIEAILSALQLPSCKQRHIDPRIDQLIKDIDHQFTMGHGADINLAWAQNQVHLSASRLQHLFSEQAGMPWRAWLLWARLLAATNRVTTGQSHTDAAIAAGFSDSAHYSRSFKAMLGLAPGKTFFATP